MLRVANRDLDQAWRHPESGGGGSSPGKEGNSHEVIPCRQINRDGLRMSRWGLCRRPEAVSRVNQGGCVGRVATQDVDPQILTFVPVDGERQRGCAWDRQLVE